MARRSIDETNKIRATLGLSVVPKAKRKNTSILTQSKKARHQEILHGMLNKKGKSVVEKVLNKALTDGDEDQMACLKLVIDRILPADYISKIKGSSNQINIQISGVDETSINTIDHTETPEDINDDGDS